jgi:hypothetical protein
LQKIVVLCATQPESTSFDNTWGSYLQENKVNGTEVVYLIEEVLRRAEGYQKSNRGRQRGIMASEVSKQETRERMLRVSERLRHKNR